VVLGAVARVLVYDNVQTNGGTDDSRRHPTKFVSSNRKSNRRYKLRSS
jgi:hypothetical protein